MISQKSGLVLCLASIIAFAGCSKKEPASTAATAPAVVVTHVPTPAPTAVPLPPSATTSSPAPVVASALAALTATPVPPAAAATAPVALPDFKTAPISSLVETATTTLSTLAAQAPASQPEVAKQAQAVTASLKANQPVAALDRLKELAASAQAIPGASAVVESTKKVVSAWALKQGFDTAKVSPLLGSLQQGDYPGLASQVAVLLGAGGLTDQQKSIVSGVLNTFGLDAQANNAIGKMKSLFGGEKK